ncbi:hypothetical protein [Salinibacterium sp. GXW1014]|uniref:hypothetical protein n=1 Tax=Salinibacterium sp. GXW1014 TaxID=3377838 RepID=UPI00383AF706
MAKEYEPILDDEREEELVDEPEVKAPPTIDPDERIEVEEDDDVPLDDERPA